MNVKEAPSSPRNSRDIVKRGQMLGYLESHVSHSEGIIATFSGTEKQQT
jgi:hypothetical protein